MSNSSITGNATHLNRTPGGPHSSDAHDDDNRDDRMPVAATATATTPPPDGVAHSQDDAYGLPSARYYATDTDTDDTTLDSSSTASDDTQPQRLEEDFPHFDIDIDVTPLPRAPVSSFLNSMYVALARVTHEDGFPVDASVVKS